jgi:hypothetical protein
MTWVQHATIPTHICAPPMREVIYALPTSAGDERGEIIKHCATEIDGEQGDLWRCDRCGRLWRVGDACDACDWYGSRPHPGMCTLGLVWRPATLWQRLRHRRRH